MSVLSLLNEGRDSLEHVGAAGELSRCWKAAETSPETCKIIPLVRSFSWNSSFLLVRYFKELLYATNVDR
uniref:Uncharacterized protein n=1 Tax=Helianthus annuus TaxID=4232 RepID=A0A251VI37_HELAN